MTTESKTETAKLTLGDQEIELPVIYGTEGEVAIDIRNLRAETGAITFDPGLANTGSCLSKITFLDGENGILRYCGYTIQDLAKNSSFLEVAWLLINQELPTKSQLEEFTGEITTHTMIHENLRNFFLGIPRRGHPMATCAATVGALSTFYQDVKFDDPAARRWAAAIRLLAKFPTIAAYSYKHSIGQPFMYPRNDLSYSENILHMLFATPCEDYVPDPVLAQALDLLLILHADHEQNCSTSTVRTVGSSLANLFASVSAGISALWGPLHGGANQNVIEMLIKIHGGDRTAREFMEDAKDKKSGAPYADALTPFVLACKAKGVHITYTYFEGAIRVIPPLNISRTEIDLAIDVFSAVLDDLERGTLDAGKHRQKNKVIRGVLQRNPIKRVAHRL